MSTETKPVELSRVDVDPDAPGMPYFAVVGDFETLAGAVRAAKDCGPGEYAYTTDPDGGHYEGAIVVDENGGADVQ